MSDTDSADNLDDQLLSAYIDGELRGEELAQVEQRLTADPAAQQFVTELRALSATLRSLPRADVGKSLRESVLGQTDARLAPAQRQPSRRWIWASLAVAAALLLSVYLPTARRDERPIAAAKPGAERDRRAEPRLEASSEIVAESADSPATGEVSRGLVAPAPQPSLRAAEPQPALADKTVLADVDDEDPSLVVHLTLNRDVGGGEQFNLLLTNNRIALDNAQLRKRGNEADSENFVGQADLVLVEAPVEQIGQVLRDASDDTWNYQAIRFDVPEPAASPVAQWRQWERGARSDDEPRETVPINIGDAEFEGERQRRDNNAPARARRVDADWYARRNQAVDGLDTNAVYQFGRGIGGKLAMKKQLKAAVVESAGSLRVLFILHTPAPAGESAAAPANE